MFEGIPTWPDASRFWKTIDKHNVSIFYTAPTALRALMGAGDHFVPDRHASRLRLMGSVGEPINPRPGSGATASSASSAARSSIPGGRTETGATLMTPLPAPCPETRFGCETILLDPTPTPVDDKGTVLEGAASGNLCILDSLAGPDAHRLWRPSALRGHLFPHLSRQTLHR